MAGRDDRHLLNARGVTVRVPRHVHSALTDLSRLLMRSLTQYEFVFGYWTVGSHGQLEADLYSDLDVRILVTSETRVDEMLETIAERRHLTKAAEESIHFPLDERSYLTPAGHCVEFGVLEVGEFDEEIRNTLIGEHADSGEIYGLLHGDLLFDRHGLVDSWRHQIQRAGYPDEMLARVLETKPFVAIKLLRMAAARHDWPRVMYWLARLFDDCARVLLARERKFYPGPKRLLEDRLARLRCVPPGYLKWWHEALRSPREDWHSVVQAACQWALRVVPEE